MEDNEPTGLPLGDDRQECEATEPSSVGLPATRSPQREPIVPASPMAEEETHAMLRCLTPEERERVSLLQQLLATANQPNYGVRQRSVAQKLGMTDRNVRRLLRQMREGGIESVVRRVRSDQGATRISEDWQQFIVQTYKEGNRGSRPA